MIYMAGMKAFAPYLGSAGNADIAAALKIGALGGVSADAL